MGRLRSTEEVPIVCLPQLIKTHIDKARYHYGVAADSADLIVRDLRLAQGIL